MGDGALDTPVVVIRADIAAGMVAEELVLADTDGAGVAVLLGAKGCAVHRQDKLAAEVAVVAGLTQRADDLTPIVGALTGRLAIVVGHVEIDEAGPGLADGAHRVRL